VVAPSANFKAESLSGCKALTISAMCAGEKFAVGEIIAIFKIYPCPNYPFLGAFGKFSDPDQSSRFVHCLKAKKGTASGVVRPPHLRFYLYLVFVPCFILVP
jgi:hypothetical protein